MTEKEEIVEDILDSDQQNQDQEDTGQENEEQNDQEYELDELEQARLQLAETNDKLLRLAAEFENYKKRLERERGLALKYAEEQILKELLPGIDNLERAIEEGRKTENASDLLAGVELTYKGMISTLEKFEVTALESIGQQFDPNIHEALAMEETEEVEPNCVFREFQKGYMFKDKLIRPAKVVVAKNSEK